MRQSHRDTQLAHPLLRRATSRRRAVGKCSTASHIQWQGRSASPLRKVWVEGDLQAAVVLHQRMRASLRPGMISTLRSRFVHVPLCLPSCMQRSTTPSVGTTRFVRSVDMLPSVHLLPSMPSRLRRICSRVSSLCFVHARWRQLDWVGFHPLKSHSFGRRATHHRTIVTIEPLLARREILQRCSLRRPQSHAGLPWRTTSLSYRRVCGSGSYRG